MMKVSSASASVCTSSVVWAVSASLAISALGATGVSASAWLGASVLALRLSATASASWSACVRSAPNRPDICVCVSLATASVRGSGSALVSMASGLFSMVSALVSMASALALAFSAIWRLCSALARCRSTSAWRSASRLAARSSVVVAPLVCPFTASPMVFGPRLRVRFLRRLSSAAFSSSSSGGAGIPLAS